MAAQSPLADARWWTSTPAKAAADPRELATPDSEQMEVTEAVLTDLDEPLFASAVSSEMVEDLYDPPACAVGCFSAHDLAGRLIGSTPWHGRGKYISLVIGDKMASRQGALRVGSHMKFWALRG